MKTKIILASLAIALMSFAANILYSQDNNNSCCETKSSACCTENQACCDKAATGNAGGDSTAAMSCPVSNEPIGDGGGVKFDYYGKTYTFCCEGCMAKFKKEPMDYIKTEMVCPVMGDKIESKDVFVMNNGTKYYLCCENCVKKFERDPEKYKNKQ